MSIYLIINRSEIIHAMGGKNPKVTILVLLMSQIDGQFDGYFVRYFVGYFVGYFVRYFVGYFFSYFVLYFFSYFVRCVFSYFVGYFVGFLLTEFDPNDFYSGIKLRESVKAGRTTVSLHCHGEVEGGCGG